MIVLDIETTGITPGIHQMVSLGAIDMETGATFYGECRIYYRDQISPYALQLNGFTEEQVRDPKKKTPVQLYLQFVKWSKKYGNLIGGHNVGSFDVQFLKSIHHRLHGDKPWPFSFRYVDLHSVAYGVLGKSLSMDEICKELGVDLEPEPHNALNGALSEAAAFIALREMV